MLTGWYPPFKYGRSLNDDERQSHLAYDKPQNFSPDDAVGMTRLNSTYVEFVDRIFKVKGMAATLLSFVFCVFFFLFFIYMAGFLMGMDDDVWGSILGLVVLAVPLVGFPFFVWHIHLRKDLFQYTYYPIRFNRRTRKVHFFRHNGPGGVVTVPWGDANVYFHVGHGGQNKHLRDLRCHLLDPNRQVLQTFTVGHFWPHENYVREEWELIRRYMEQGPEHCYDDERDRVITLSLKDTLHNCWMFVCMLMGTTLFPLRFNLLFPVYGALALSRWLTFQSCRKPVFPADIEAECAIAPDDPYQLPEPSFMAEFAEDRAIYKRAEERFRSRQHWK